MDSHISFADSAPYPPVRVEGRNVKYAAAMLANIGSCSSEISTVSLYFYNSVVLRENHADLAETFHKISVVEMHHLDIFAQLACLLGADPRLWRPENGRPAYWSPSCNQYARSPLPLVRNALEGERAAVAQYRRQSGWIGDPYICEMLERIILDEERHIQIFKQMEIRLNREKK